MQFQPGLTPAGCGKLESSSSLGASNSLQWPGCDVNTILMMMMTYDENDDYGNNTVHIL